MDMTFSVQLSIVVAIQITSTLISEHTYDELLKII